MQEEIKTIKKCLDTAFYYLSLEERKNMLNKLLSFGNDADFYIQVIGNNISKIGVKYQVGELKCKFYFATEYDNEIFDL